MLARSRGVSLSTDRPGELGMPALVRDHGLGVPRELSAARSLGRHI